MNDVHKNPSRAPYPSRFTLPEATKPYPSLLDFLISRFPRLNREGLKQRLQAGEITTVTGEAVDCNTPYKPGLQLIYYREIENELIIPFEERIVYSNDHILVACKPHFLPVHPAGKYVNECLVYRLRKRTGNDNLVLLHRLDRETAGLVLFSVNKETRGTYGDLFDNREIKKEYEAIASLPNDSSKTEWLIKSSIGTGLQWPTHANIDGEPNSETIIKLIETHNNQARFQLFPLTGRPHQLRLHLTLIGSQITNDRFYPTLLPDQEPEFDKPLKLLAKKLSFIDPLSGEKMKFESARTLEFD